MSDNNTFKQIPDEREEPAPAEVEKGVKSSMTFIRFAMHIAELYLAKVPQVVVGFMSGFEESGNDESTSDSDS